MSKLYVIIGTVVLVSVVIATVLITKSIIGDDYDIRIQQAEQDNIKLLQQIEKRNDSLTKSAKDRVVLTKQIDSLNIIAVRLNKNNIALGRELKTVKGRYKNFSDDSLYKEIIKVFKMDSIARSN